MSDESATPSPEQLEDLRLRDLVRSSSQPIGLLGLPDGRTLEVSDAFATLVGRSRDECLGLTVRDYSDDPDGAQASLVTRSIRHSGSMVPTTTTPGWAFGGASSGCLGYS